MRDRNLRVNTDIEEVRVAADDEHIFILVRTAGMLTDDATGVLVALAVGEVDFAGPAPGGIATHTDTWLLAGGGSILDASSIAGATTATDSTGATNAVEIAIPHGGDPARLLDGVLVATCAIDAGACAEVAPGTAASSLMNVAFRTDEPPRIWNDHDQAFALHAGDIDRYAARVDPEKLLGGDSETFEPRPGYWERIYVSDSEVNNEAQNSGSYFQGPFQHYGVYLPTTYRQAEGTRYPTTWWAHYRGGHAHDGAAWLPGIIRDFGESHGNIMIFPSARGTSTWYVGRGMEDFLEVWDDSMAALPIDPDRVYMTGYSMGGYASWLLPTLMPDRFAGASPQEGPATQGLFVAPGVTAEAQNGGDLEAQLTYNILENVRNVPYAIYSGNTDELVWITGVLAMHAKLTGMGYTNRLYQIDGGEHYVSAVLDQWDEAANYLNSFRRDPNPPQVTYRRWPAIEHAASTVSTNDQHLGYRFDHAYWVSDIEVRDVALLPDGRPNPDDWGTVDAVTLGRGMDMTLGLPEAGVGVQGLPYQMTGWRTIRNGRIAPSNEFSATLTNVSGVTFDLERMGISSNEPMLGTITTDGNTAVWLNGSWAVAPRVTGCDGCAVTFEDGRVRIETNGPIVVELLPRAA